MESYREKFSEFDDKFDAESHFLHVVLPSIVRPGEQFALKAVMMDARGMPAENWTGRVPLEANDTAISVPGAIEFAPEDMGRKRLQGLVAREEGAFYVRATPPGCPGHPPTSNPVVAKADGPRLFWGDIHMHTLVSNCHPDLCKSPEFGYWYGRNVALMDFCAAADHLRGIHRVEGNWDVIKSCAQELYDPGEFVPLLAFESSHARGYGGDNNIYYRTDDADHFWVEREDMKGIAPEVTLDQLWGWLDEQGVPYVSIPHHTGRSGKYRDFEDPYHNPERETVLEVYSWWGSSEARHDDLYLKGGKTDHRAYWRDALELGYRYGIIGSSDTHHTMPGTPYPINAENYHYAQHRLNCQGMAAIYADELEREPLFDSLLGRNCYGTTWWRPVIEFSVGGRRMGSEVEADAELRRRRRVEVCVAAPGRSTLMLFRNNEMIARERLEGPPGEFTFTDDEPLGEVCIQDAPRSERPFTFYYVKVEGAGSQLAWSSPVWLLL